MLPIKIHCTQRCQGCRRHTGLEGVEVWRRHGHACRLPAASFLFVFVDNNGRQKRTFCFLCSSSSFSFLFALERAPFLSSTNPRTQPSGAGEERGPWQQKDMEGFNIAEAPPVCRSASPAFRRSRQRVQRCVGKRGCASGGVYVQVTTRNDGVNSNSAVFCGGVKKPAATCPENLCGVHCL